VSAPLTLPVRTGTVDSPRAMLAAATTVLAWGSAFVAIRWVGTSVDPGPLALGRLVIASAILGAMVLARRHWEAPTRREWILIGICGVVWFAIYNVALNAGEQRVDAGTAAMVVGVGPILIAVAAGLLLGEGFPRWLLVGSGVAFVGTLLIGVATARGDGTDLVGVLLCLVAAVAYAVGVLCQKLVLGRLPALQVTFLACTIGTVACLPFVAALVDDVDHASTGAVAALVYLGVVPTALAFSTWAYALARMDAGRLGVTTYLVSPVAVGLGALLLGELPALLALVGGAVALVGVWLSRRRPRAQRN
jgi:drug/metabolite transporter (DMT)-like permease